MMVVIAVVMMARNVDARHVVMAVVVMVARPRMIVTMMMSPILNLRHHPGRALLNCCGDTRGERGRGLRLRRRRSNNEQAADSEQAEKFFDEHQCSPSGGV